MTFISAKTIHGKKRYYLEKSVRLPDGRVKKYSLYLKGYLPGKAYPQLKDAESELETASSLDKVRLAGKKYVTGPIFTEDLIHKMEVMRLGYKTILRRLTEKQLQDVIDRFTVNFTYESNALEGNSLTLKDVTFILGEGKILEGKDLREVYETINTRRAMGLVFGKRLKITEKDILHLHRILVENTGVATGYKRFPNFLLNRQVKTAPPERVKEEMDKLIAWHHSQKGMHPLQMAALFHGRFEKIHPFEDGNGRVGRLLLNIILLEHDYPPLIVRKTHRLSYLNALEAFDNGHHSALFRFLVERYKKTYTKFFKVYVQYL